MMMLLSPLERDETLSLWSVLDNVTKLMAIVFLPFTTFHVYYDTLAELFHDHGLSDTYYFDVPTITDDRVDRLRIFTGDLAVHQLSAVKYLIKDNCAPDTHVNCNYNVMVAVGMFNGTLVDIPLTYFPWPSCYFALSVPRLHDTIIPQGFNHSMLSSCEDCYRLKRKCEFVEGMDCIACINRGSKCKPRLSAEIAERRRMVSAQTRDDIHILCPLYQYIINVFLRSEGVYFFSSHSLSILNGIVDNLPSYPINDLSFLGGLDAYQKVKYQLALDDEGKVITPVLKVEYQTPLAQRLFGFELVFRKKPTRPDRLSVITPHFGMSCAIQAYSFMNTALELPGTIFSMDTVVVDRSMQLVPARIVIVANVVNKDDITFVIGWKIKKD